MKIEGASYDSARKALHYIERKENFGAMEDSDKTLLIHSANVVCHIQCERSTKILHRIQHVLNLSKHGPEILRDKK